MDDQQEIASVCGKFLDIDELQQTFAANIYLSFRRFLIASLDIAGRQELLVHHFGLCHELV
jgi:hypothetical protein